MKTPLTFLLALTFLFLFSGSVYGDDYQDGMDAYKREDVKTAYRLWLPLAEQGHAAAQFRLGNMYNGYFPEVVPEDSKEKLKWYRLSAEQGYSDAQTSLGSMYWTGEAVVQDYKEAVKWYRLAAEQVDPDGMSGLGSMYAMGKGVPQDYVLAHMWFNLCVSITLGAKRDTWDRIKSIGCISSRDALERWDMTPAQVEKAQEMARNWKPKK